MNCVTADSNIYISAFLRGGKPLELLEMARAGQIELAVTEDILNESHSTAKRSHDPTLLELWSVSGFRSPHQWLTAATIEEAISRNGPIVAFTLGACPTAGTIELMDITRWPLPI